MIRIRYAPEIVEEILAGLRRGLSVRTICKAEGFPSHSAVFDWLGEYPAFAAKYKEARIIGCEAIADELFEIADDDQEHVLRSKLRVHARQWYLSKIVPKIYGDRVEHEHKGLDALATRLNEGRQRALGVSPQSPAVDHEH